MAKHNIVFGTLSGKIGNIVFFRRRGRQVERALVPSPADPRTDKQCVVRAQFANCKNLWRALLPYVGEAWRGVSRYGSAGNAFAHHNARRIPTASLQMSRAGNYFPNLGVVTYGGLPIDIDVYKAVSSNQTYNTSMMVAGTLQLSVGTLAASLLDHNRFLRDGDILHFLGITYSAENTPLSPSGTNAFASVITHAEIPLDISDNRTLQEVAPNFVHVAPSQLVSSGPFAFQFVWPSPAADYDSSLVGSAVAVFVERPSNPHRSRYSRASWSMGNDDYSRLQALTRYGNISVQFGNTFKQVNI